MSQDVACHSQTLHSSFANYQTIEYLWVQQKGNVEVSVKVGERGGGGGCWV